MRNAPSGEPDGAFFCVQCGISRNCVPVCRAPFHIAYRRGINTLLHVIDAVGDGKILRFVEGNKTVVLEKDGFEAVLALTEYGNQKSWLLSGWQTNKPDASGEVGTQSTATQLKPTFSRQELGAGLQRNISQLSENANFTDGNGRERTETDGNGRERTGS